jgi:hypothetical protein
MKYLKTFEDYQGQILAGNTANAAPMNVNLPLDSQSKIGDMIEFKERKNPDSKEVKKTGKILKIEQNGGGDTIFIVTLNVEGSDWNKPGVKDEDNTTKVTMSKDSKTNQFIGPYTGLRNPTGSGFVSSNVIDVTQKGSGVYGGNDGATNFGAADVSNDMAI